MLKFGKLKLIMCSQEAKYNRTLLYNTTITIGTLNTHLNKIFKYCHCHIMDLSSNLAYWCFGLMVKNNYHGADVIGSKFYVSIKNKK
jgi:hypothetical protein